MRKMFTGPMQFTPYRPWSPERKRAARERIAASKEAPESAPVSTASHHGEGDLPVMADYAGADTFGPWPLTAYQAERIGYRRDIIRSLTREIEKSSDPAFLERATWMIELKKSEIEGILSEENGAAVWRW